MLHTLAHYPGPYASWLPDNLSSLTETAFKYWDEKGPASEAYVRLSVGMKFESLSDKEDFDYLASELISTLLHNNLEVFLDSFQTSVEGGKLFSMEELVIKCVDAHSNNVGHPADAKQFRGKSLE